MAGKAWMAGVLLLLAGPAAAQPRPASAQIGSWELSCPDTHASCLLRHRDWVLPPSGARPGVDVEVERRGAALVPVLVLRGLPLQAALGGVMAIKSSAVLRFDAGPALALHCALGGGAIVCAPQGGALAQAAAALPTARSLQVRVAVSVPGMDGLPEESRTLVLADTAQALAQYRAAGASGEALPAEPGLDWQQFLDRALKAVGFANGAADLLPMLSRTAQRY